MRNFINDLKTYIEKTSKAKEDFNKTVKENHEIYKEGSTLLIELDKRAEEQYKATLDEAFELVMNIPTELNEAKTKVLSALSKPVPESLSTLIANYELLGDAITDKDMAVLMAQSEHNFVGRRIIEMKFNKQREVMAKYEDSLARIEDYTNIVNNQIIKAHNKGLTPDLRDYGLRALLHEPTTTAEIGEINNFLDCYVNEPENTGAEA